MSSGDLWIEDKNFLGIWISFFVEHDSNFIWRVSWGAITGCLIWSSRSLLRHWSVRRRSIVGPGLGAFLRSNYLCLRNGFSNADGSRVDRLDVAEVYTARVGGLGQRVAALRRIWILLLGRGLLISRLLSLRCIIVLSSLKVLAGISIV